jgi:hypothetical protein
MTIAVPTSRCGSLLGVVFQRRCSVPFRRIETPPATQVQSDWLETNVRLRDSAGGVSLVKRYGFVMTLSHSRKTVIIWSESMNQLAWHHVHNEAFKRLGGIAAVDSCRSSMPSAV